MSGIDQSAPQECRFVAQTNKKKNISPGLLGLGRVIKTQIEIRSAAEPLIRNSLRSALRKRYELEISTRRYYITYCLQKPEAEAIFVSESRFFSSLLVPRAIIESYYKYRLCFLAGPDVAEKYTDKSWSNQCPPFQILSVETYRYSIVNATI